MDGHGADTALIDSTNASPTSIRVVSLNCWGLKYLAKHRHARLKYIGEELARRQPAPEIVGLQECWTQEDYLSIRESTRHILPYGKFYYSGIFGGGLAILSKWPIVSSQMYRYPLNGRPAAFYRGDWFVGKGVACAEIKYGPGRRDVAEVFTTHLHAPYEREPNDSYLCHRTAQAWEITRMMRAASERGSLVIGLGDFNMRPLSLAHQIIEAHSPVRDAWRLIYPDSSIGSREDEPENARGRPVPTAEYNLKENGATCDSCLNTWRWEKAWQKDLDKGRDHHIPLDSPDPGAKRLDYIFFSSGACIPGTQDADWRVSEVCVGMTARHPELKVSLSDHFSVEATLSSRPIPIDPVTGAAVKTSKAITHDVGGTMTPLPLPTYNEILAMTASYITREINQGRWRRRHLWAQVAVSIGCFIAVWWSPHNYVSFILILVSTLGLSAGVVDGLMGGLFIASEFRALKEFEWEVRNARDLAYGGDAQEHSGGRGNTTKELDPVP